jgi:hypothetical protein
MDTFFATKKTGKSSRNNTCCQLFVTDKGFVYVVPMKSKSEVLQALKQFAKEVGAPEAIICDAAREQMSQELRRFCNAIGSTLSVLEEGTPWANKAELYIGLIKEATQKDMKESNCPLAFWDYCVEHQARISNLTAKYTFKLHGTNAHTAMTSDEGDISNLCQYTWYQWCYFRDQTEKYPFNREILGRVLGPAKGEGNADDGPKKTCHTHIIMNIQYATYGMITPRHAYFRIWKDRSRYLAFTPGRLVKLCTEPEVVKTRAN